MIYQFLALIAIVLIHSSCNDHQNVRAKIYERKVLRENRLLIKYKYLVGHKSYINSATVKNRIIPDDSINIIVDPSNPARSLPDF